MLELSCVGRCGDEYNSSLPCQCDQWCSGKDDTCCQDHQEVCIEADGHELPGKSDEFFENLSLIKICVDGH